MMNVCSTCNLVNMQRSRHTLLILVSNALPCKLISNLVYTRRLRLRWQRQLERLQLNISVLCNFCDKHAIQRIASQKRSDHRSWVQESRQPPCQEQDQIPVRFLKNDLQPRCTLSTPSACTRLKLKGCMSKSSATLYTVDSAVHKHT